jgi:hypothetical protein
VSFFFIFFFFLLLLLLLFSIPAEKQVTDQAVENGEWTLAYACGRRALAAMQQLLRSPSPILGLQVSPFQPLFLFSTVFFFKKKG